MPGDNGTSFNLVLAELFSSSPVFCISSALLFPHPQP